MEKIELNEDQLWELSGEYADRCGLSNFFDEDEIILKRMNYIDGWLDCIKYNKI